MKQFGFRGRATPVRRTLKVTAGQQKGSGRWVATETEFETHPQGGAVGESKEKQKERGRGSLKEKECRNGGKCDSVLLG